MNVYEAEKTEENVVKVVFPDVAAGWEQWLLLSSDRHHDSPHCAREQERGDLVEAQERNAIIIDCGDLFDAMQGKFDPRRSMDDVRPEDAGEDYLDRIIRHAAQDYEPFAGCFLVLGRGNHETSIRKHNGIDLTSNLVERLNAAGGNVYAGGYGGWVRFVFRVHGTKSASCNLKYFHGRSSNAPVTRGVIQTARQAVYLPDADIVLNGHNHEGYHVTIPRERISVHGNVSRDLMHFIRTPGYKDPWSTQKGNLGFEASCGGPKATGCAWVRFFYDGERVSWEVRLSVV